MPPSSGLPRRVALCGGIHMDRIASASRPVLRDTSTPGHIEARPGGVAANVARVLAALDTPAALCGRVGRDGDGDALLRDLAARAIDTSAISRSDLPTASYLALHDPDGSLVAAIVDAAITEEIDAHSLVPLTPAVERADIWFVDANLLPETIAALVRISDERFLCADAVSLAKAGRLTEILPRIDLLFANREEARHLAGETIPAAKTAPAPGTAEQCLTEASAAAQGLVRRGARRAVVTAGSAGLAWAVHDGTTGCLAALPAILRDVTGAGDALIGATLAALARDLELEKALSRGLAAAALILEQRGADTSTLSVQALDARLASSPPAAQSQRDRT